MAVCNHPSPMFLLGYVYPFFAPDIPVSRLLLSVYIPVLLLAFLARAVYFPYKPLKTDAPAEMSVSFEPHGSSMDESILSAVEVLCKIGGYLMLFTMLSYFFRSWIRNPFLSSLIPGFFEMTSGIAFTVQSCLPSPLTIALCFSFAAFGGLSGVAQTASVLRATPFSGRRYFFLKLAQAIITFGLVMLLAFFF